jgi:hypothetical protein
LSANRLLYPGGVDPPLDGKTPVFEEVGADPTIAPGLDRPIGSYARFGTSYYWKTSSSATGWKLMPVSFVEGFGVSTLGNTAGSTGTVAGTVVLAGVSGVSLSQSTNASGATISILASAEAGVALAAGTQTGQTGTVVLSNSNGFTFGMSGSSRITADYDGVRSMSAGTSVALGNVMRFADSNGVSFGASAGSIITASVAAGATATGNFGAIAAGTQTATSGTVSFGNNSLMTFGMSDSINVTGSHNGATVWRLNAASGSATFSVATNSLVFHSGGGIDWAGSTTAGGQGMIQAHPRSISVLYNNGLDRGVFIGDVSNGTIHVAPLHVYNPLLATRADQVMAVSNSASAAASITMRLGLYTMSGSTASQASSSSRTWAYNSTIAQGSYTQVSGSRFRSMSLANWNMTHGPYMMAVQFSVSTSLTSGTHQPLGGRDISINADEYPLSLGARANYWQGGFFSVTSAALPASFHLTDVVQSGSNDVLFVPFVTFAGTF